MKIHPAAAIFPEMPSDEFDELKESIRKHGQQQKIVVRSGEILDGRHRFEACKQLGVVPKVEEWKGQCGSPIAYVAAMNLHRRHLNASQRAACAAEALEMFEAEAKKRQATKLPGGKTATSKEPKHKARDDAAAAFKASPRMVQDAKKLKKEAPELFRQVRSGSKTISKAKAEHETKQASNLVEGAMKPEDRAELERAQLKASISRAVVKVGDILAFDASDLIGRIDEESDDQLLRLERRLTQWFAAYNTARRRAHLTWVKGGKK